MYAEVDISSMKNGGLKVNMLSISSVVTRVPTVPYGGMLVASEKMMEYLSLFPTLESVNIPMLLRAPLAVTEVILGPVLVTQTRAVPSEHLNPIPSRFLSQTSKLKASYPEKSPWGMYSIAVLFPAESRRVRPLAGGTVIRREFSSMSVSFRRL